MHIVFDGYRPGALAGVVGLQMDYYAREWNFGLAFETKVAAELAEFLSRFDPERDLFLTVWRDGDLVGSICLDVSGGGLEGSQLRWFMVCNSARGIGLGKQLMARAISHADSVAAGPIWLTTFAGLKVSQTLYMRFGFQLESETDTDKWNDGMREQVFERPAPTFFGEDI